MALSEKLRSHAEKVAVDEASARSNAKASLIGSASGLASQAVLSMALLFSNICYKLSKFALIATLVAWAGAVVISFVASFPFFSIPYIIVFLFWAWGGSTPPNIIVVIRNIQEARRQQKERKVAADLARQYGPDYVKTWGEKRYDEPPKPINLSNNLGSLGVFSAVVTVFHLFFSLPTIALFFATPVVLVTLSSAVLNPVFIVLSIMLSVTSYGFKKLSLKINSMMI